MKKVIKFFQFSFVPTSADLGLLVLRVWIGLSMLLLHGWGKAKGFQTMSKGFSDPLGIGSTASLVGAVFGEVICPALIIIGLLTRFAATIAAFTMAVAFFAVHQGVLKGPKSGEMAFLYACVFVVLIIAGPGRFSVDKKTGGA